MVDEVDLKLLEVSSPVKVTLPPTVARVAEVKFKPPPASMKLKTVPAAFLHC